MCAGCWFEFDSPKIDTPKVRELAAAIADVYEFSCVGGNLHVYIDDWNLEDSSILGYEAHDYTDDGGQVYRIAASGGVMAMIDENYHEADTDQLKAERHCAELLAAATEDERASALGLYGQYWGVPGRPDIEPDADDTSAEPGHGDVLTFSIGRRYPETPTPRYVALPRPPRSVEVWEEMTDGPYAGLKRLVTKEVDS